MAPLLMAQPPHNIRNGSKKDGGNPTFHEFFGTSCAPDSLEEAEIKIGAASASDGGYGPVSTNSDLGSGETQMKNYFQGVPVHDLKNNFVCHETSNRFPGRKRSNSDSVFTGLAIDRRPQIGSDSLESFHLMKMLCNSARGERQRVSYDEESSFRRQPPNPNSTSHSTLQPPVGSRSDMSASVWEHSLTNVRPLSQYPSHLGQFATCADNISSRGNNAGPSVISLLAADEGSRTGIKGSGIFSAINDTNGVQRNTPGMLTNSRGPKSGPQNADHESSDPPRRPGLSSASRQMTIFYAGQTHVFDEVHPNKADVIMALAGSNGVSWSTTSSPKCSVRPSLDETQYPNRELRATLSIPDSSVHGFNQGGHLGSIVLRPTGSLNQPTEPNTRGKQQG